MTEDFQRSKIVSSDEVRRNGQKRPRCTLIYSFANQISIWDRHYAIDDSVILLGSHFDECWDTVGHTRHFPIGFPWCLESRMFTAPSITFLFSKRFLVNKDTRSFINKRCRLSFSPLFLLNWNYLYIIMITRKQISSCIIYKVYGSPAAMPALSLFLMSTCSIHMYIIYIYIYISRSFAHPLLLLLLSWLWLLLLLLFFTCSWDWWKIIMTLHYSWISHRKRCCTGLLRAECARIDPCYSECSSIQNDVWRLPEKIS